MREIHEGVLRAARTGGAGDRGRPGNRCRHRPPAHAAGAKVAVFDRDPALAKAVADELDGLDTVGDVRLQTDVEAAIEQTEAKLGPLSILVNNAGITGRTDLSWNLDVDEVATSSRST